MTRLRHLLQRVGVPLRHVRPRVGVPLRHLLPLVVVLPLLGHVAVGVADSGESLYPWADAAVVELETARAADGDQLLGTYSRFRWHHPGPAMHYLLVPLYELLGGAAALNAGAALVGAASIVGLVLLARRYGGWTVGLWAAAVAGLYAVQLDVHVLRDYWFPHIVLLPFALFVTACAALATGDARVLPLVVAVGSVLVQCQVGFAPVVTVLAVAAAAVPLVAAIRARRRPGRLWPYGAAAAAGALLWAQPIYEELTTTPGNLARLRDFFTASAPGPGLSDSLDAVANVATVVVLGSFSTFGPAIPARGGAWAVLVALAALLAAGLHVALRRRRSFAAALCGLSLLAIVVQSYAITNIREGLSPHLVLWLSAIGVPALLGIGAALGPELRQVPARVATAAIGAGIAVVTAIGFVELADNPSIRWDPAAGGDYGYEGRVEPMWRQLDSYARAHAIERPRIAIVDEDRWLYATGAVVRFDRSGYAPRVDPEWTFLFGSELRADGGEDATLLFANPGPAPWLPRGARTAARTGEVMVYAIEGRLR